MRSIVTAGAMACLAVLLLGGMTTDESTSAPSSSEAHDTGIPVERIIASVARKTGKKYLVDPRVRANVLLIGQEPSAAQLVPILRPMLPQSAQLAAYPCTNTLLMVDSYANVRRIEAIVKTMDVGAPYKPTSCDPPPHHD